MKYLFILLILLSALFATILNVPGDLTSIQMGIDASVDGDTVLVQPGTYVENINFNGHNITLGSLFIMTGDTSFISQTIIDGDQLGNTLTIANGESNQLMIAGLSITNGNSNNGGGIYLHQTSPVFDHMKIFGNNAQISGGGVGAYGGGQILTPIFNNTEIYGNYAQSNGGGVHFDNAVNATFFQTNISNNNCLGSGGGMYVSTFSNTTVTNSTIQNNQAASGGGVYIYRSSPSFTEVLITGNQVSSHGGGIAAYGSGNEMYPSFTDVTITENTSNGQGGGINFDNNVNGILENLIISDNSCSGSGGGMNISYLSNSSITNSTIHSNQAGSGGGIYISRSSPSLMDVIISENQAASHGGGIAAYGSGSVIEPSLYMVDIIGNSSIETGGGINFDNNVNGTLDNVNVTGNTTEVAGGGMYISTFSNTTVTNSTIQNNSADYGGGIRCVSSSPILSNVKINYNSASNFGGGFSVMTNSNPVLTSVEISGNNAYNGGGINCGNSNPSFMNLTLSNNTSSFGGGINCSDECNANFVNSILWGNSLEEIYIRDGNGVNDVTLTILYSDVQAGDGNIYITNGNGTIDWLEGNIDSNPLFENPGNGSFQLTDDSPCIDAGDPLSQTDPDNTVADMGAYYFHHENPGCTDPIAVNYDQYANIDDGTCIYLEDIEPHFSTVWSGIPNNPMGFYIASATIDGIDLRVGDEIALFDSDICVGHAQLESEIYPDLQIFASQDNPATEEQDGFINGNEINYRFWDASEQIEVINVIAEVTAGQEAFQSLGFSNAILSVGLIPGCTDQEADNYNPEATYDEGACLYLVHGCMDDTACNYNPEATSDDGSCIYNDCNGECGGSAYLDDCGVCDDNPENDNECIGCTDPWALNYDPDHTMDDESCEYPGIGDMNGDSDVNIIDVVALVAIVLEGEDYIVFMDLNNDSYLNIIDIVIIVDIILNPQYLGCTDPLAVNFSPEAIYSNSDCIYYGSVTDIDGNPYNTIVIGDQNWMAENLKVTHYRNGDQIPHVTDNNQWAGLSSGAYCYQENDPLNIEIYGNLYNWFTVVDPREICPDGWHIPSDEEFIELEMHLGMSWEDANEMDYRGVNEGGKLKEAGTMHWNPPNEGATNESGFKALPGGFRYSQSGYYDELGESDGFWSTTEYNGSAAWYRRLNYSYSQAYRHWSGHKKGGFSLRCVQANVNTIEGCTDLVADNFNPEANIDDGSCEYSCIDIDGNVYNTIIIGEQEWMAENLEVTHYRNGDSIPNVTVNAEWSNLTTGAFSTYDNDQSNSDVYGNLYNWYTIEDARGVCPEGWHLPSDAEIQTLEVYLGMNPSIAQGTGWRGTTEGGKLKAMGTHENEDGLWHEPNTGATNEFGFTELPSGYRYSSGNFDVIGLNGYLWTADSHTVGLAWMRSLRFDNALIYRDYFPKQDGLPIRCIKD